MQTDLALHVQETRLCDTHEHLNFESEWVNTGPDILQDLFGNYVTADLAVAGASPEALQALLDAGNPDIEARFAGVARAWKAAQWTGYGEAVRVLAKQIYSLDEITPAGLLAANEQLASLRRPGERLRLLKDVARLDHVQVDNFCWPCGPDSSGLDFFLYDLSWAGFSNGDIDVEGLERETGISVSDVDSLNDAMEGLFAKYASLAIAVKSQHAYSRTLEWRERSKDEAATALAKVLSNPETATVEDRLALGDWCWARGVELSSRHGLPFKLHTGYYAGHSRMPVDRIRPGHLCRLLETYPNARFVLMHIGYPYSDELLAVAKHFPNVWVDLCWAWSIDPATTEDFVRRFIHAVPANKLLAFGGDTRWPTSSVAYARQARAHLTRALQAEVDDHLLSERNAIQIASRFMRENQYDLFDIEGTRASVAAAAG